MSPSGTIRAKRSMYVSNVIGGASGASVPRSMTSWPVALSTLAKVRNR